MCRATSNKKRRRSSFCETTRNSSPHVSPVHTDPSTTTVTAIEGNWLRLDRPGTAPQRFAMPSSVASATSPQKVYAYFGNSANARMLRDEWVRLIRNALQQMSSDSDGTATAARGEEGGVDPAEKEKIRDLLKCVSHHTRCHPNGVRTLGQVCVCVGKDIHLSPQR